MPDVQEYIKRLMDLKIKSLDEYNKAMENYRINYPAFYAQLNAAMNQASKPAQSTSFKLFLGEFKFYLIAIGVGIGVIIYLLFLLMTR